MAEKTIQEKYDFLINKLSSDNFTVSELFYLMRIMKSRRIDPVDSGYVEHIYDKVRTVIKRIS